MRYIIEHTVLFDHSFSFWHLLTILVFLGVCAYCHRKFRKMREEEKDLEDIISGNATDQAMAEETMSTATDSTEEV